MEELFEGASRSLIIMNILVRIFPAFSRIQTVYGEIRSMRKNVDQNNFEYGHFLRSEYTIRFTQ